MCLYPKLIENKKYKITKKNGGNVPVCDDKRKLLVPVGCGKCIECTKQKQRNWQIRLLEEVRTDKTGQFVTLSFSTEELQKITNEIKEDITGYNLDNEIAKYAIRHFLENWRKSNKKSVKHWLITELGHGKYEHMHIHGIIFTNDKEEITKKWKYGNIYIGDYVSEKTINYIIKYVSKTDETHKNYQPKIFTTPGIGKGYLKRTDSKLNEYKNENTKQTYTTRTGHKIALPTYYRNNIYTEEQREKLWTELLDKNERWVMGEKIDISTKQGEKEYWKTLNWYQNKNKTLGYGDDSKNWEKIKYENERRKLIYKKRFKEKKAFTDEEPESPPKKFGFGGYGTCLPADTENT